VKIVQRLLNGAQVDVRLRKCRPIVASNGKFPSLEPGMSIEGGIREDRDLAVVLRDGTTIYVDAYRPSAIERVPALIAWSPYGKRAGYAGQNAVPGVPAGTYSAATKEEGPDPVYWCHHGYAIVNPDARGAGNSEGDIEACGTQEGRDIADLVEWIAEQEWCTGKVGMTGNSWLAWSQWRAAVERPPHLACIAPWEGCTDMYRQLVCRGGIPEVGFMDMLMDNLYGSGCVDDLVANAVAHPLHDAYWQDKVPALAAIEIPTYITAGMSHFHLYGSFDAFRAIGSERKWLRIHRDFEWPDYYQPEHMEDLRRFFDRYLKGVTNGWEMTPRVRLDVMDRGDVDHVTGRAEKDFPLVGTRYERLHLDASHGALAPSAPGEEAEVSYEAGTGYSCFEVRFDDDTELTGFMKLRLWVEARESRDMDLFVVVQKLDESGEMIPTLVMGQPHPGSPGMLRVSHRELDQRRLMLSPQEIVPVDIGIWPTSRFWHAGEQLRVVVSGHYVRDPNWFEPFRWDVHNEGLHVIHTGGRFDSHLLIPVIPARRPVVLEPPL
jgi:predicted acyl esterase